MPYDPNSPPLPPLNDGYPDDWHVPPSAQDDSFPDDWHVPPSAQPNAANPDFTASPAPPGSIAAYWSRLAADRQRTAPWTPPIFQDASDRFPPIQLAPTPFNLPLTPAYGLFGHPLKAPDWQQDSASGSPFGNTAGNPAAPPAADFSASLLFGGTGGLSSGLVSDQSDPSNVGAPAERLRRSSDAPLPGALQGYFSGLVQPAVGSIDHPAYLVPLADKRKDPRNLDLFDERAFGNTPPLGSAAPRLIPPTGNPGPRPPTASPQSPPAQAPSAPRASPPVAQAQPTLPGIPPPSGARADEPPGPAKAGGVSAAGPLNARDSNWRQLVENIERIRDAWAQGGGKLPQAISAALPKYDGTTYGILITNEGDVVPLQSGPPDPRYSNYPPAKHVEGKAAIWIREHGSTGGVVYHNNPGGTCGLCNSQVKTLLPEGASLRIVPPADAVPKNERAKAAPTDNLGNENIPKSPAQADFFARSP